MREKNSFCPIFEGLSIDGNLLHINSYVQGNFSMVQKSVYLYTPNVCTTVRVYEC